MTNILLQQEMKENVIKITNQLNEVLQDKDVAEAIPKEKLENLVNSVAQLNSFLEILNIDGENVDQAYLGLLRDVLKNGHKKEDRTGTGTTSVFSRQLVIDLKKGFPMLTTKRLPLKVIASELAWFIKGDTNIQYLLKHNNHIWDEWPFQKYVESEDYKGPDMTNFAHRAEKDPEFAAVYKAEKDKFCKRILEDDKFAEKYGSIGSGAYGAQWRSFNGPNGETADQLKDVIKQIKNNPDSRRLLVSAWHPVMVKQNAVLPPCHFAFQFYVINGKISCKFIMRSSDLVLGLPFNFSSYALLTHLVARECGLEVDKLIYDGGDIHIYSNHYEQVQTQLEREPRELPELVINPELASIFDFEPEDVSLEGYNPHPVIKAPVAV